MEPPAITIKGRFASIPVSDMSLDTGAEQTMLHRVVVPEESFTGEQVVIRCAYGNTKQYPFALVIVKVADKSGTCIILAGCIPL